MKMRVVVALVLVLLAAPAFAATFNNVEINGIPLDSAGGFTNPTITVWPFGSIFTITFDAFIPADSYIITFTRTGGAILTSPIDQPPTVVVASGPVSQPRSFTTWGDWIGTITIDFIGTTPDYAFAGPPSINAPAFPVTFMHTPEPGTLALFGVGALGLGFAAVRRRKQNAKA